MEENKDTLSKEQKLIKFLKYLMQGKTFKVEGKTYCMSVNYHIGKLSYILDMHGNPVPTQEVLEIKDANIPFIMSIAEKVPDDDYFIKGAEIVMAEYGAGKYR